MSCGWQIKHTLQWRGVHPRQYSESSLPQPLWGHSSTEFSNPWQFRLDSHTLLAPRLVAVHSLFPKMFFIGGLRPSCLHITFAVWYGRPRHAQIVPHVPLYLTCTWPALGVSIPTKRASTSVENQSPKIRPLVLSLLKGHLINQTFCIGTASLVPIYRPSCSVRAGNYYLLRRNRNERAWTPHQTSRRWFYTVKETRENA